ncbi:MAG: class I SAM-dependent methyltransferase, partial [Candidatus Andersenbacteria bacterium]|nr:class I SAM-dependent methyltransferase [Candidatus Andersenbacteria bacterium]
MTNLRQQLIEPLALRLRGSRARLALLKPLLASDNVLRRWIAFFASENALHPKHRLMNYHQFFIDNVRPADTVLDIGCGGGHVAIDVAQTAKEVVGIDISGRYLAAARRYRSQPNLTFVQGDATTYRFGRTFDVAILSNVLEHLIDRVGFLHHIRPLARLFLIRVPMLDRDWIPLLKKELGIEYRLDPTHTIEYTERDFRAELDSAAFIIAKLSIRFGEIYCVAHPR